ncbi:uncharacterized [Tachysurus ichikawai]
MSLAARSAIQQVNTIHPAVRCAEVKLEGRLYSDRDDAKVPAEIGSRQMFKKFRRKQQVCVSLAKHKKGLKSVSCHDRRQRRASAHCHPSAIRKAVRLG